MVEEKVLFYGISAYPGVIFGKCKKIRTSEDHHLIHRSDLQKNEISHEIVLFKSSLNKTEHELTSIIAENEEVAGSFELREILTSQKDMIRDPLLYERVVERIQDHAENAPLAVETTIRNIYEEFMNLGDSFFQDRADHILDIGKRITKNLMQKNLSANEGLNHLQESVILVARDLTPSEMIHLDKTKVLGIATDFGGKTGHMAIIARNYGIPTIVGLRNIYSNVEDGEYILLDADRGFLKKNPDIEEFKSYGIRSNISERKKRDPKESLKTLDGERIYLKANLENDLGCEEIIEKNAEGIGLYRSEVLFLQIQDHSPTEEEQFVIYRKILRKMGDKSVVIRVFDVGADKFEIGTHEDNPFLGNRGIRYLLRHPNLFKEQIRALLRSSIYGNLQILLPMITTVKEITKTKELIEECRLELENEGYTVRNKIPLGIMIETPSCAIGLENYLSGIDFVSIGTNDLLQYLMAVGRNNYSISDLYNPLHIVFLQTLENIVLLCKKKKIPVSICGEVATDPDMIGLLIAMGFRELSVSAPFIQVIQDRILKSKLKDMKSILKKVKELSLSEKYFEIESLIREKS
jgi:phosphotransferase system enzyme I (PtsI)